MQVKGRAPAESPTVMAVTVAYPPTPTRSHVSTVPSFSPRTAQVLTLLKPQFEEVKEGDKRHTASRQ